ncbi:hypothetical protein [Streptomyces hainanensis]|uniref:Uncharacterized protein n=1 Tax=Streptomyces hainanensis TaxID=402648 RepID=A0A4R4TSH0_9ACTN|nr:hypothetical protein [Streptomyces hainanensis]TDC78964.1 hypothetical protein E1283_03805 [Streptomyces hainanensis]
MIYLGFYRELGPTGPEDVYRTSVHDAIAPKADYPAGAVAEYLEAGHPILDVTEFTSDVVAGAFGVPGGSSVMTDGDFAWRFDLVDYVKVYSPRLPEEFLERATAGAGAMPRLSRERLIALTHEISADLGFRRG